jgi:hypothetical protein
MTKLTTIIHCPMCGFSRQETMPTDACLVVYHCTQCGAILRPKPGDCCVFCSYADDPCPSIQETDLSL